MDLDFNTKSKQGSHGEIGRRKRENSPYVPGLLGFCRNQILDESDSGGHR